MVWWAWSIKLNFSDSGDRTPAAPPSSNRDLNACEKWLKRRLTCCQPVGWSLRGVKILTSQSINQVIHLTISGFIKILTVSSFFECIWQVCHLCRWGAGLIVSRTSSRVQGWLFQIAWNDEEIWSSMRFDDRSTQPVEWNLIILGCCFLIWAGWRSINAFVSRCGFQFDPPRPLKAFSTRLFWGKISCLNHPTVEGFSMQREFEYHGHWIPKVLTWNLPGGQNLPPDPFEQR